jgi:hypothetical protein
VTDRPSQPGARQEGTAQELVKRLMHMLEHTYDDELPCDEIDAVLDQFTELAVKGEDIARLMPLVERHLDLCRDCREEYEALKRILEALSAT